MRKTRYPVIVGVTSSVGEFAAVRLAAREAALRGLPLRVVHAFVWPLFPPSTPCEASLPPPRVAARQLVRAAVARATAAVPGLEVAGEVIDGAPLPILLRLSQHAPLLVVGAERLGGSASLPVDSIPVQLAARAGCPVMVVSGPGRAEGPVVVGVDDSPATAPAVAFALAEAALHDCPLLVVRALGSGRGDGGRGDAAVFPVLVHDPRIRVTHRNLPLPAAQALIEQSRDARLLVVGVRGWRETLLGPVTQESLHRAQCPVVVTRAPASAGTEGAGDQGPGAAGPPALPVPAGTARG